MWLAFKNNFLETKEIIHVNSESKKDRGSDKLKSPKTNVKPKQTHVILIKGIGKES